MTESAEFALYSPVMTGGEGADQLIGGYGVNVGHGDGGDDALAGDRAEFKPVWLDPANASLARQELLVSSGPPKIVATVYLTNSMWYRTRLIDQAGGGNDVLFGDAGNDAIHGGAGADSSRATTGCIE